MITISRWSGSSLLDTVIDLESVGYTVDKIWKDKFLFINKYYAKLSKRTQEPRIEFIIGPITNKYLKPQEKPPTILFTIGPVVNK